MVTTTYKLGFTCDNCNEPRNDKSERFCWRCYQKCTRDPNKIGKRRAYLLGLKCAECGGRRNDDSKQYCGNCYVDVKRTGITKLHRERVTHAAARQFSSKWIVGPDGTMTRTKFTEARTASP